MATPRFLARSASFSAFSLVLSGLLAPAFAAAHAGADQILVDERRQQAAVVTQIAAINTGTISGQVLDDRGQPLAEVVISAVGGSTSFAVSDRSGSFTLRALLPGPYLVRAHREGYSAARHTILTVRPAVRTTSTFTLRKESLPGEPRLLAAGAGSEEPAVLPVSERDESETAWRLRRLKRSILKDSTLTAGAGSPDWFVTDSLQMIGRAVESSARMAGALFADSPLRGQVNLLTTGTFDAPADLLQMERTRGVALFSLGAPVGTHGEWAVKAALNHGDLSSWLVAGNYHTRQQDAVHRYQFGLSYGVHRYEGGNLAALAAISETARNVGAIYGHDEWQVADRFSVGFGAHYGHYDYLAEPAHLSPRLSATLRATDRTTVRAVATRRVTAPGAEEFLPPSQAPVLPPQRTFSPLTRAGFSAQDARHYELGVEQQLAPGLTIGVRGYHQRVDDQLVTVFGLRSDSAVPAELGHYVVGNGGDVAVHGWTLAVAHEVSSHLRGSVEYSLANAQWAADGSYDRARLARTTPSALRTGGERLHDLTTAVQTGVPRSATRVSILYKLNTAFSHGDGTHSGPAIDGRWDVQVVQGLPFMRFTTADWEMLVAVRNLFRDAAGEASAYDELLVVRPPKRLVGGITVKF